MENIKQLTPLFNNITFTEEEVENINFKMETYRQVLKAFPEIKCRVSNFFTPELIVNSKMMFCEEFYTFLDENTTEEDARSLLMLARNVPNNLRTVDFTPEMIDYFIKKLIYTYDVMIVDYMYSYSSSEIEFSKFIESFIPLKLSEEERSKYLDLKAKYANLIREKIIENDFNFTDKIESSYREKIKTEILRNGTPEEIEKMTGEKFSERKVSAEDKKDILNKVLFNSNISDADRKAALKKNYLQKDLGIYIEEILNRKDYKLLDMLIQTTIYENNRIKNKEESALKIFQRLMVSTKFPNPNANPIYWEDTAKYDGEEWKKFKEKYYDLAMNNFDTLFDILLGKYVNNDSASSCTEFFKMFRKGKDAKETINLFDDIFGAKDSDDKRVADYKAACRRSFVWDKTFIQDLFNQLKDNGDDFYVKKIFNQFEFNTLLTHFNIPQEKLANILYCYRDEIGSKLVNEVFEIQQKLFGYYSADKDHPKVMDFVFSAIGKELWDALGFDMDERKLNIPVTGKPECFFMYVDKNWSGKYSGNIGNDYLYNYFSSYRSYLNDPNCYAREFLFKNIFPMFASDEGESETFVLLQEFIQKCPKDAFENNRRYDYIKTWYESKRERIQTIGIYEAMNYQLSHFEEYALKFFPEHTERIKTTSEFLRENIKILSSF